MSPAVLAIGARVGERFELVERAVDRGCGDAWRARDPDFSARQTLLKLFDPLDAGALDALQQTSHRLRELRHPGLLAPVATGVWEGRPFVAYPWYDGASLTAALDDACADGHEPARSALERLSDDLCGALEALHTAAPPFAHGALHPGCVLTRRAADGTFDARLVDACIAHLTPRGTAALYPDCAAPELAEGYGPHAAADVYALSMVLRRVLREPSSTRAWASPFEGFRGRRDVPAEVWEVMERAAAKRHDDRPPTATALRAALRRAWRSPRRAPIQRPTAKRPEQPTPAHAVAPAPPEVAPLDALATVATPSPTPAGAERNAWATSVLQREVSPGPAWDALREGAVDFTLATPPPPPENPWSTEVLRAPVQLAEEVIPTVHMHVDPALVRAAPPHAAGARTTQPRRGRSARAAVLLALLFAAGAVLAAFIVGARP